jgi:protein TonB
MEECAKTQNRSQDGGAKATDFAHWEGAAKATVVLAWDAGHTGKMAARGQHNYTKRVWIAAALVHLGLFAVWQGHAAPMRAGGTAELEASPLADRALDLSSVTLVDLPAESTQISGAELVAMVGAGDHAGADPQEALRNYVDAPGRAPGMRASGLGGPESFATRSDRDTRSASTWNTQGPTLMPHVGEAPRGNTSAESLHRAPTQSYSDQERRRTQARSGTEPAVAGIAASAGQSGAPGTSGSEWLTADPRFDTAPRAQERAIDGAVQSHAESARMDLGARSTEHTIKGPVAESLHAPDRSNRIEDSPFHLGAPSAGQSAGTGARGTSGKSNANNRGSGSAAQAGQGAGTALASTRATRNHPYFNQMYRRIDRELRFPKKLALALEQGDLVLSFQLDKMGRIRSLKVSKGSGFADFDSEAVRAFRAAAPFGEVPGALLGSRDRVAVLAPYYFRNPLIR